MIKKYGKYQVVFLFIMLAIIAIFFACKKDNKINAVDIGYNYFPNQVGKFIVYDVDSFYYNDFTLTIDTFHFQVKEKVAAIFFDNENRPTERLERFYRKNSLLDWVLQDVWVANLTTRTAEKVEENERFVKLTFPLSLNTKWDGNRFNTLGSQEYQLTALNEPKNIGIINFDSTLTVLQMADSNLLEKNFAVEIYAKNIGLIYKKYTVISDKDSVINFTIPLNKRANSGVDYTYKVNNFGTE